MKPFIEVKGVAAPLMRPNIDTDQIAPGKIGMQVDKTDFGQGLFANWRYRGDGSENPEFVLNQEPYRRAVFLVADANFGCGSSREWAVWALRDFGVRAVIAPSFGAIFASNCYANGLLPIALAHSDVSRLADEINAGARDITISLETCQIVTSNGRSVGFDAPRFERERLLEGLGVIEAVEKRRAAILDFQERDRARRPWVYDV